MNRAPLLGAILSIVTFAFTATAGVPFFRRGRGRFTTSPAPVSWLQLPPELVDL